jgi:hypothetical protein
MRATLVHKQTQCEVFGCTAMIASVLLTAQLATGQTFSFTPLG